MFAYFIGGPEDLTKRVIQEALPEIRFAVMPKHFTPYGKDWVPEMASAEVVTYRLFRSPNRDTVVYLWDKLWG